jgi:hypothetical protein
VSGLFGNHTVISTAESSLSDWGLQEPNFNSYISRLRDLGTEVTLWPHVDEQITESKWEQVKSLDAIAKQVTGTHRPTTRLLNEEIKIADILGKVLKREGSNHVLLPGSSKASFLRTDRDVQNLGQVGRYRWLVQDFAPYLLKVGEWRVMFCGGREIYTIQTEPGRSRKGQTSFNSMRTNPHRTCYTLEEMRWVVILSPELLRQRLLQRCHENNS